MSLLFAFRALFLLSKMCRRVEKFITRFEKNHFLLGEIKSSFFSCYERCICKECRSLKAMPGTTSRYHLPEGKSLRAK